MRSVEQQNGTAGDGRSTQSDNEPTHSNGLGQRAPAPAPMEVLSDLSRSKKIEVGADLVVVADLVGGGEVEERDAGVDGGRVDDERDATAEPEAEANQEANQEVSTIVSGQQSHTRVAQQQLDQYLDEMASLDNAHSGADRMSVMTGDDSLSSMTNSLMRGQEHQAALEIKEADSLNDPSVCLQRSDDRADTQAICSAQYRR